MIEKRFSASAETCDRYAYPQRSLAASVCDALPEIYPDEILELGSGTGQLTRILIDRFPDVLIETIDISPKMIEQGVSGTKITGTHTPLTRGELSRLIDQYQEHHRSTGGVIATYETATFLLTKTS